MRTVTTWLPPIPAVCLMLALAASHSGDVLAAAPTRSNDFESAMAAAMERMDHGMMTPATGDPDRDFAAAMIPHHQGAVDMAEAELGFGHDKILRRLAQEIIVEQLQEIRVMQQALDTLPAAPVHSVAPLSNRSEH